MVARAGRRRQYEQVNVVDVKRGGDRGMLDRCGRMSLAPRSGCGGFVRRSMKISWPLLERSGRARAAHGRRGADARFRLGKGRAYQHAKAILDKVAERYAAAPRPMTVDGHSDRSGASGGNLASSRRRAEIARDYLMSKGIPVSAMTVRAYGETWPMIATEDGVREVQNRRIEIRWSVAN